MFKVGDILVYRRDVCEIIGLKEKAFNDLDYFVLVPISDKSLKMEVPINSNSIRSLITRDQVEEIINKIPEIKKIERLDVKNNVFEAKYRELLNSGNYEDLISIIKTTYIRNQKILESKKKIGDKEANFFKLAEQYLYNEIAIVLGMSYEETKIYIMNYVTKLEK